MKPYVKSKSLCTVHGKGSLQKMGIGFDPCGDRQAQVGLIGKSCLVCLHFVHKKYNGMKRSFSPRLEFIRSRCQDTQRPVNGRQRRKA